MFYRLLLSFSFALLTTSTIISSYLTNAANTKEKVIWDKFSERWPWEELSVEDITFKPDFIFGAAIAEFQNSGDTLVNSNWNRWQNSVDSFGKSRIVQNQKSRKSCDFWNLYKIDIENMKKIGLKSLRFSIDWSMIEPREGEFNQEAIQHYHELCDALLKANIIPMVTLHHFVHPNWFEDLGGFEKEQNIKYFVRFSELVFKEFNSKVKLWCTINEPGVFTFMGYMLGFFPPGQHKPLLAYQVLKNLMQAHVETYQALKKLPGGDQAQIGFAHQHLVYEPYHQYNPIEYGLARIFNPLFTEKIIEFLKTGNFEYKLGDIVTISYQAPRDARNPDKPIKFLDFIGLNYYSRVLFYWGVPSHRPHEIMTEMPYAVFAEGFYQAIAQMAELQVPIYVTENGVSDTTDSYRELWLKRYLFALHQAIQDGYDVRGYYWWTLTDNFEWDNGFTMKFGLFEVDFTTQKRKLRNGAKYFEKVLKATYS